MSPSKAGPKLTPKIKIRGISSLEKNALEKAKEIYYQACEAKTKKRALALLEQALKVSPFCADAILMRTDLTTEDPEDALYHSFIAMKAALLEIGDEFDKYKGNFWGFLETRPYMRALAMHAEALRELTAYRRAIIEYQFMLELNPNDNLGVRYDLLPLLIEQGYIKEAKDLLKRYKADGGVVWLSMELLISFCDGCSEKVLLAMLNEKKNASLVFMIALLTKKKRFVPYEDTVYHLWSDDEARVHYPSVRNAWQAIPGALEWLSTQVLPAIDTKEPNKKRVY